MRELALHILDLMENSIRAGATIIAFRIEADPVKDRLRIEIEDNGPGLKVSPEVALNPFYTTKRGKRTGLGLTLFQEAAERAGGRLRIEKGLLGGLLVRGEMNLRHIDRTPMGDLPGTLGSMVCTHPAVDFHILLQLGDKRFAIQTHTLAEQNGIPLEDGLSLAQNLIETLKTNMEFSGIETL